MAARQQEEPIFYKLADHAPTIFWTIWGMGVGATVAVFFGAMDLKPELANILGGILGSGLGAAGGVLGGLILYSRQRRDLLAPSAINISTSLRTILLLIHQLQGTPRDSGLLDMLEWWVDRYLQSSVDKEAQAFGAEIGSACNAARELLRGIYDIMGSEQFDQDRSADSPMLRGTLRNASRTIENLVDRLNVIAGKA